MSEWYAISFSHVSSTDRPTAHPPLPILSSLFSATREIIAYTASIVGDVAEWVGVGAKEVEKAAKRGEFRLREAKETIGDAWAGLGNIAKGTGDESVDRLKDEVIDRVQETITRAHRNPQYHSALRTMLKIIRKYATKLSLAASSVPETRQSGSNPRQTSKYS